MLSEILTNEMQPKILNQTRLLANLMTKGVSKSLTRSARNGWITAWTFMPGVWYPGGTFRLKLRSG
jgi:hypothetical protein